METITCPMCGREVPYEKSRLFFAIDPESGPFTFRTCRKGDRPHELPKSLRRATPKHGSATLGA